jgi:CRISPR-associated protein Cas1
MKRHLNTLFVTTPRAYLRKEGEAVAVRIQNEKKLRVPLINLGGIVAFGSVGASPALLGACARAGLCVTYLTDDGRFLARVGGFTPGNVLLRRTQYRWADDHERCLAVARPMVLAKIANARHVLLRTVRDHPHAAGRAEVESAAARLQCALDDVAHCQDIDRLRGLEGDAAKTYFDVFDFMAVAQREHFTMNGRSRRPPLDRMNALLSFLYTLLTHDARAACESHGLDPQVGFLHADRPGRPSLALDLIEEFRPLLADRLALSLINRQQLSPTDFVVQPSGGVLLTEAGRKTVIVAYQKRKQETLTHGFIGEKTTVGLLLHLQALLLARFLRGDLSGYPPFMAK